MVLDYTTTPARAVVERGCVPGSILVADTATVIGIPVEVSGSESCVAPGWLPFRVLPAARLSGSLAVKEREDLPSWGWLDISLCRPGKPDVPVGRFPFEVGKNGDWHARVPSGCLHSSVQAQGFGSVALTEMQLGLGETQATGSHALRRGATVAVRVLSDDDGKPVGGAKVRLVAESRLAEAVELWAGRSPGTLAGAARSSDTGWASIEGVAPGIYYTYVEAEGKAPAIGEQFAVASDRDSVTHSTTIGSFGQLTVTCGDAAELDARGIRLSVKAAPSFGGQLFAKSARVAPLGPNGAVDLTNLPPGTWVVDVSLDRAGLLESMDSQHVHLGSGEKLSVSLGLGRTIVRGRLTLRKEPVVAELMFLPHEKGQAQCSATTDETGRFVMVLNTPGTYDVRVFGEVPEISTMAADVEIPLDGKDLDIKLPDRQIQGSVVDDTGKVVPGATVSAEQSVAQTSEEVPPRSATLSAADDTDSSGAFILDGIAPGIWQLIATSDGKASRPETVTVPEEGGVDRVVLVLGEKGVLSGFLLTAAGMPVPNASLVVAVAPQLAGAIPFTTTALTEADGRFEIEVLPGVGDEANLAVVAMGYPISAFRAPIQKDLVLRLPALSGSLRISTAAAQWNAVPLENLAFIAPDGNFLGLLHVLSALGIRLDDQQGASTMLIPALGAGRWRLVYLQPSEASFRALFYGGAGLPVIATIDVAPGLEARVELPSFAAKPKPTP